MSLQKKGLQNIIRNMEQQGREKSLKRLMERLRDFAQERDWGQFHSPKNLAMALIVEAAEVVELFQWMTQEQSRNLSADKLRRLREEIGDVFIYLANLADKFDIDLLEAAWDKIDTNERKYPARLVRGKSEKYTIYEKQEGHETDS